MFVLVVDTIVWGMNVADGKLKAAGACASRLLETVVVCGMKAKG